MTFKQKDKKWHFDSMSEAIWAWLCKFVFHIESPSAHCLGYKFKWDMWKATRKRGEEK